MTAAAARHPPPFADLSGLRIAVVTNLLPPLFIGGYEIGAGWIVAELARRGARVRVLVCDTLDLDGAPPRRIAQAAGGDAAIDRVPIGPCVIGGGGLLQGTATLAGALWLALRGAAGRRAARAALRRFRPDLILVFNPAGIVAAPLDLCRAAAARGVPVAAYVSDYWPVEWPASHPLASGAVHGPLRRRALYGHAARRLGAAGRPFGAGAPVVHALYCSRHVAAACGAALPAADSRVIPWGVPDTGIAPRRAGTWADGAPLRLVYAGQIVPHKGLDLLIEALARLRRPHRLTVFGDPSGAYAAACRARAAALGLDGRLAFAGRRAPEEIPALLRAHGDVLVLPSRWAEPSSLVLRQAMALGLVVVASDGGGTPEIVDDGEDGVLFAAESVDALVVALDRLEADRAACARLGAAALRRTAGGSIAAMVDAILAAVLAPRAAQAPAPGSAAAPLASARSR